MFNVSCPPCPVSDPGHQPHQNSKVSKGEVQGRIHLSCPSQCDVGKDSFHSSPTPPSEIELLSCDWGLDVFSLLLFLGIWHYVVVCGTMWYYVALWNNITCCNSLTYSLPGFSGRGIPTRAGPSTFPVTIKWIMFHHFPLQLDWRKSTLQGTITYHTLGRVLKASSKVPWDKIYLLVPRRVDPSKDQPKQFTSIVSLHWVSWHFRVALNALVV